MYDFSTMTIRQTLDLLLKWNEAYRNGTSAVSDAVYDEGEDALAGKVSVADPKDLDAQEARAFLASIGAAPADTSGWTKALHAAPMGSLNKAQTEQDFVAWHASCGKPNNLVTSDKCDGISISLRYEDGQLCRALTRGDGDVGEDITRNVVRMKGVVHVIKGLTGHIRGEIVLLKSDWKAHFPTYANPRNAAGGIAKSLDGAGVEHLTVLHYQIIREGGTPIARKAVEFQVLERIGCAVPTWYLAHDIDAVKAIYDEYVAGKRAALDYDIDGLVVEHDDLAVMEALGDLNKRPKGATAWKFPHSEKPTVLRSVEWQVGKSGRITPVAHFDPVHIDGATIKQASLANVARVRELKLWIGCNILVSRRNMVIPYVEKNLDV